jgi:DNA-binding NarL/FixJ family response regulator
VRLLLVDDHTLFRAGLKILLTGVDKFKEILEVSSGQAALSFIEDDERIDVVLLDYALGDMSGLDVLAHIKIENPEIPVIMLSAYEDSALIQELLNKGASGFITKTSSTAVMLSAISLVLSGGIYVPPAVLLGQINAQPGSQNDTLNNTQKKSTQAPLSLKKAPIPTDSALSPKMVKMDYKITGRQTDVLRELGKGLSNKEIAKVLNISPSTVKVHVAAILKELDAKNRTIAVTMAKDMGLFGT